MFQSFMVEDRQNVRELKDVMNLAYVRNGGKINWSIFFHKY